jgi:hypothetical protein
MKIDIKISAGVVFKLTTLHPVKTFAACITSTSVYWLNGSFPKVKAP